MQILEIENKCYPSKLRNIQNPPTKLYVKGNVNILEEFSIAIVGTRNFSEYGKNMCLKFTKDLVEYNINIVSGLAKGIDSFAHTSCIENGGKTIAVLPCGFDNIYPKENYGLYEKILENNGCIVSEYEPNIKASYNAFLERNRIVSGLANGTLVIEAGLRSGTSVTARITKNQGKTVFCIPSSLQNSKGKGTNILIQKGAKLVTSVKDILKEFPDINFVKRIIKQENFIKSEYVDVYKLLSENPIHIDEIYMKSSLSIQDVNYMLLMLELEDNIKQLPGKFFVRK